MTSGPHLAMEAVGEMRRADGRLLVAAVFVAQEFKPDVLVRIPAQDAAAENDIVRGTANRRACAIIDRAEGVREHLRLRTIDGLTGSVLRCGGESSEVALRGHCPLNGKSGQKPCERSECDSGRHGHFPLRDVYWHNQDLVVV